VPAHSVTWRDNSDNEQGFVLQVEAPSEAHLLVAAPEYHCFEDSVSLLSTRRTHNHHALDLQELHHLGLYRLLPPLQSPPAEFAAPAVLKDWMCS